MENNKKMTYETCAVCGKRSRQPKLTPEQEYGWDAWFLDGMPKYSEREKVYISQACPYCGYSNRTIAEDGIANLLDFKAEEYKNPLRVEEETIQKLGIVDLMNDVKICMRSAYLLKGSDVECYEIALEEYLIAIWLLEREMHRLKENKNTMDEKTKAEIIEICKGIRTICLEHAIFCCNRVRKHMFSNEFTILLIELYRRRGLMDLAMTYCSEMLENEMWDFMDEKLMIQHQIELCKKNISRPTTWMMERMEK